MKQRNVLIGAGIAGAALYFYTMGGSGEDSSSDNPTFSSGGTGGFTNPTSTVGESQGSSAPVFNVAFPEPSFGSQSVSSAESSPTSSSGSSSKKAARTAGSPTGGFSSITAGAVNVTPSGQIVGSADVPTIKTTPANANFSSIGGGSVNVPAPTIKKESKQVKARPIKNFFNRIFKR